MTFRDAAPIAIGDALCRPVAAGAALMRSSSSPRTYPDHAMFNASKDQLKAMPQFDYSK